MDGWIVSFFKMLSPHSRLSFEATPDMTFQILLGKDKMLFLGFCCPGHRTLLGHSLKWLLFLNHMCSFGDVDIALFSAGGSISKKFAHVASDAGATVFSLPSCRSSSSDQ